MAPGVGATAVTARVVGSLGCGVASVGIWPLSGSRAQRWGHGTFDDSRLTWADNAVASGAAVRQGSPPPRILARGPRVAWFGVIAVSIMMTTGDYELGLLKPKGGFFFFLMLAWQASVTPVYDANQTI